MLFLCMDFGISSEWTTGGEFYLSLYVQDKLSEYRFSQDKPPYLQTTSTRVLKKKKRSFSTHQTFLAFILFHSHVYNDRSKLKLILHSCLFKLLASRTIMMYACWSQSPWRSHPAVIHCKVDRTVTSFNDKDSEQFALLIINSYLPCHWNPCFW